MTANEPHPGAIGAANRAHHRAVTQARIQAAFGCRVFGSLLGGPLGRDVVEVDVAHRATVASAPSAQRCETGHVRVALLLNPKSGNAPDPDDVVRGLRDAGAGEVRVFHLDEAARVAACRPERVVIAGGDGSIGCGLQAAYEAQVPLAVLATGTANDFARAQELPLDLDTAIALAGDPDAPQQERFGGTASGRAFVNVASVGLAVEAARFAERYKRVAGPAAYALGAIRAGLQAMPVRVTVAINGKVAFTGGVWQVLVGATGRFGGGSGLGEADATTGQLTVAIVPAGSRWTLPVRALGLRRRSLEHQGGVEWGHTRALTVHATARGRRVDWNLDGEVWTPPRAAVELAALGPVPLIVAAGNTADE